MNVSVPFLVVVEWESVYCTRTTLFASLCRGIVIFIMVKENAWYRYIAIKIRGSDCGGAVVI